MKKQIRKKGLRQGQISKFKCLNVSFTGQIGDKNQQRPKQTIVSGLVDKANESKVLFCGMEVTALVDSGPQVTTVSGEFYNELNPAPLIIPEPELDHKGPDGRSLSYIHCIAATIPVGFMTGKK